MAGRLTYMSSRLASGKIRHGSGAAPGRSPRIVLDADSPPRQLVADLVGTPEILRPPRFVAFGDQRSDLRFGNLVSRAGAQKTFAFPGQQPEQSAKCAQLARERRRVRAVDL